jgi:twitching motility protein PilT
VLEGIVTQTLLPKAQGRGRVMAAEILVVTPAIRALIRDDKVHQIYSSMQAGKKWGMQTLNDALYALYMNREVTAEECLRVSGDPTEFQRMIGQLDPADEGRTGQPPAAKPAGTRGPASGTPARR